MASRGGFKVRPMERQELDLALDWAADEGWNPGLHDADAFFDSDPEGYLVGLLSGEPIGCISAVAYNNAFGFLGLYIVKPEHRGKGFGMELWRHAMRRLGSRSVGLDGVVGRLRDYERQGFVLAYRNIRYESAGDRGARPPPGSIIDLRKYGTKAAAEYEKRLFPASRTRFLEKWLDQRQGAALGCMDAGKLVGYGVVRKCVRGFKVGPLFADTRQAARDLFWGLAGRAAGEPVYIDVPEANGMAVDLAKEVGMHKVFETARMYKGLKPDLDISRIYGVTTLELG
nr:GNAT family N-acetyltransferase [uncultured Nitrososphaera sp.]